MNRKKYTVTTPNKMNIMTNMDRIAEKNIGLKDHNNGMLQSGRPMVVANKMRNKYFLVLTSKRVESVEVLFPLFHLVEQKVGAESQ